MTITDTHAFTLAEPDVCGPLAVFPILGPAASFAYRSFAEAAALGVALRELPGHASVNTLVAVNPLDVPVLFYEGEEVRGAQQDRTLDVSVLVGAGATVELPVTCVEQGRWDGGRHEEEFAPAPQASHPGLRRMKSRLVEATGDASSGQGEVWAEVARVSALHGADGETGALRDAFTASADASAALREAMRRRDGQLGAVCCVGGEVTVVDLVGHADVFAALHGPLVAGYALDAAEHRRTPVPAPEAEEVADFLRIALGGFRTPRPAVGLGEAYGHVTALGHGSGLELDGELVAFTAFAGGRATASRIRRPSRRR